MHIFIMHDLPDIFYFLFVTAPVAKRSWTAASALEVERTVDEETSGDKDQENHAEVETVGGDAEVSEGESSDTLPPRRKRSRREAVNISSGPLEIIKNNKGGDKLCYKTNTFTKRYTRSERIRWECSQRVGLNCKGSVVTNLAVDSVLAETEHRHCADDLKIAVAKVKLSMKQQTTGSRGRPKQILADAYAAASTEVCAAAGRMESIKRNIRRQRHGALPKEPMRCQEFVLEGQFLPFLYTSLQYQRMYCNKNKCQGKRHVFLRICSSLTSLLSRP